MKDFFTNNLQWHEKIGRIYAMLERVKISEERAAGVMRLRMCNRILSVGSTTAIEGNRLTTQQVFDVINDRVVWAPPRDIKEVKNAYAAYEQIPDLDPYSVDDFLKVHRLLTADLIEESGCFRTVGVSVVNSKREVIHTGANFAEVPQLINELFEWGKTSEVHALIKSAAMHFMIEHIHPFRDGNGRIGRLWQTLVLSHWNAIFAWIPAETMIRANQAAYYGALQRSHVNGVDCQFFIDFMLDIIESSMNQYIDMSTHPEGFQWLVRINDPVNDPVKCLDDPVNSDVVLELIKADPSISYDKLVSVTGRSRATIKRMIKRLKQRGYITRMGSDKSGYWKIN